MPLARSAMLETDLAALWIESELRPRSIPYRQCLPDIILPTGEVAELDLLACIAEPEREVYEAMEFKSHLNDELVEQCLRWVGARWDPVNGKWLHMYPPMAHRVRCGCLHAPMRPARRKRWGLLANAGVFISTWNELTNQWHYHHTIARFRDDADTSILADAFARGDATLDPCAGSGGAKRQTAARAQWQKATEYLRSIAPRSATWKEIARETGLTQTARAALRAHAREEWLGVEHSFTLTPTEWSAP